MKIVGIFEHEFRVIVFIFLGGVVASFASNAWADDYGFSITPLDQECTFQISGELNAELAARSISGMSEFIASSENWPPLGNGLISTGGVVACLNSEGGDFEAGINLMKYFQAERISTRVGPGRVCFSACAIAFMGGTYVTWGADGGEYWGPSRSLDAAGLLGFHAPRLPDVSGNNVVPIELANALYGLALSQISEVKKVSNRRNKFSSTTCSKPHRTQCST
jgi:hypothetical protein